METAQTNEAPQPPRVAKEKPKLAAPMDMAEAPMDGKAVWLFGPEKETVQAVWRHTRRWDKNGGLWRTIGFWAVRNAGGLAVPFEPTGWLWVQDL